MKQGICAFVFLLCAGAVSAHALDPFSVYTEKTPKNCLTLSQSTDEALSLPDLIEIGICNNPALNRDYTAVQISQASLGSVRSEYLPAVTLIGSVSQSYSKKQGEDSDRGNPYTGDVALSWLIYDFGGRSARTDQISAYLKRSEQLYNAALHDTILAITTAYFETLSAQEVLKSSETSLESYRKSYQESNRRFELGLAALSDKLLAQTSYEQSKLSVEQAKNTLTRTMGDLAVLLNVSPDTRFDLKRPPRDRDISKLETDMPVSEMMAEAIQLRPEIQSQLSALEAARQGVEIAKSASLPNLSAKISAGWDDNWKYHSPYAYGSSVGLSLSVPLFTGFKDTYNISKAKFELRDAELATDELTQIVKNEVWAAYQNYVTAVASYKITGTVLNSAEENERVAFTSYQVGQGSILNLLTATSQLAEARREKIVAFYKVLTTKSTLYRAIGRIR